VQQQWLIEQELSCKYYPANTMAIHSMHASAYTQQQQPELSCCNLMYCRNFRRKAVAKAEHISSTQQYLYTLHGSPFTPYQAGLSCAATALDSVQQQQLVEQQQHSLSSWLSSWPLKLSSGKSPRIQHTWYTDCRQATNQDWLRATVRQLRESRQLIHAVLQAMLTCCRKPPDCSIKKDVSKRQQELDSTMDELAQQLQLAGKVPAAIQERCQLLCHNFLQVCCPGTHHTNQALHLQGGKQAQQQNSTC
jgi:hypothetical protein